MRNDASARLERNGYFGDAIVVRALGAIPKCRRNVRVKCAASEKPAAWAASVRLAPCIVAARSKLTRFSGFCSLKIDQGVLH
jgi:hypothetical protein